MREDKQHICDLLLETLNATNEYAKLEALTYVPEEDIVNAVFENCTIPVNIKFDSGSAMVRDIMRALQRNA